jgi:uncharacterized repeat protein (TIGR01451 family)
VSQTECGSGTPIVIPSTNHNGAYTYDTTIDNSTGGSGSVFVEVTTPNGLVTCGSLSWRSPTADLSVVLTAAAGSVADSTDTFYTATITNNGTETATGVTLDHAVDAQFTLTGVTAVQGSCSGIATISCELGSLANGASTTVIFNVNAGVVAADTLVSSSVEVSGALTDGDAGNNISGVYIMVTN